MKISGSHFLLVSVLLFLGVFGLHANADQTAASVKSYLLKGLEKINAASQDFVANSEAYSALVAANGGSVEAAYKADPKKIDKLVAKMQENYKAMDSFGYETIEGIVAGVPSLADYDIYLDAGVPASEGPEDVAPVVLDLGNGTKDRQARRSLHLHHRADALGRRRALGDTCRWRQEGVAASGDPGCCCQGCEREAE